MSKRLLNTAGDTIVEVLIVLAVLSLAFGIALATSNRGIRQARNAQEHTQALDVLNTQIEDLREAMSKQVTLPTLFCMTGANTFDKNFTGTVPSDANADNFSAYAPSCKNLDSMYNASITYNNPIPSDPTQSYYEIRVRWNGTGGNLGVQQEDTTYKIFVLTQDSSSGIPLSDSAPQIKVIVNSIAPTQAYYSSPTTLSCNGPQGSVSGTTVTWQDTLTGDTYPNQTTDGSSSTTFQNLVVGHSYSSTIAQTPGSPGQYQICTGSTSATAVSGITTQAPAMLITPVCNIPTKISVDNWVEVPYWHDVSTPSYWWSHDGYFVNNTSDMEPRAYYPNPPGPNPPWGAQETDPSTVAVGTEGYQYVNSGWNWMGNNQEAYGWNYYHTHQSFYSNPEFFADPPGTQGPGYVNQPYPQTVYDCP